MPLQEETKAHGGGEAASVFQLYQPGLASDHVLQLCYLRRRAPRRLHLERASIEDKFVLPRPELQIASLLPPAVDLPLEQLIEKPSASSHASSTRASTSVGAVPATALNQVKESAKKHFLQPQAPPVEVVRQWKTLSEADWLQLYKSLQRPKLQPEQDDEMTGLTAAFLPSVADVCWLLEQCSSDAFVGFVWDHLLIALLQQCVGSEQSEYQRLLTLLAVHPLLASLSPKDFRAKVRSRNLRQVDDSFGAQAELALRVLGSFRNLPRRAQPRRLQQPKPTIRPAWIALGLERDAVRLAERAQQRLRRRPLHPPGKGKFKLRAAKEPLPLLTEKDSSRETKPRPTFLKSAGASASADKTKNSKPSVFAANSFARPPPAKDSLKMRTGGFSFTKFQPKTGETKKVAGDSSGKAVPTLAAAKPFLGKFSVSGLNKKTAKSASDDGSKAGKGPLFKAQVKGSLPFTFRADTKSSAAKKRKTAESVAHQDKKNAFPCKSFRTEGFALKGLARSSKGVNTGKQPPNCDVASEKAQRGGIRSSFSIAAKKGVMANDGAMLKKRGLALHPAETGPASKRSKRGPAQDVQQREGTADNVAEERMESGNSPADIVTSTNDASGASPGEPAPIGLERDTPPSVVGATESVQPAVLPPPSPDCREECLSGVEEELALKLVCSLLDDDKEDEFLSRAAAIQDFTDRVGLEQKQISNRLLDAHADISESLLDALTDLMAEEGGIGIDKLVFDMNLDIDIDDAFLQEPELQVLH